MEEKKKCKYCQSEIDKKAKVCPNCRKKQAKKGPVIAIIVIILVIGIALSSGDGTTPTSNSNIETTKTNEKFTLLDGYSGYSDEYGMSYYIEGSIKNNTNKEYNYVQVTFNLYDAEGAQLGTALANVNNLEANGLWKFKAIGLGGEAKNVASYKLMEITGY